MARPQPFAPAAFNAMGNPGPVSPQLLTMSSREIAALTRKRHDNVKRTIADLHDAGLISNPQIEAGISGGNGVRETRYLLGKRDTLVVVARLSPEFTAKVVDRWQELESQLAPAIPQTMAQALRLAAEQAEQLEQQQVALALAAPKVEFVDRYVEADTGSMGFRQVCKLLGANEARFRHFLTSAKVMYLLGGVWTPHAQHMNTGRFVVKTGHAKQNDHVFTQAKFTSKGVEWVSGLWRQECQRLEKMGVK